MDENMLDIYLGQSTVPLSVVSGFLKNNWSFPNENPDSAQSCLTVIDFA